MSISVCVADVGVLSRTTKSEGRLKVYSPTLKNRLSILNPRLFSALSVKIPRRNTPTIRLAELGRECSHWSTHDAGTYYEEPGMMSPDTKIPWMARIILACSTYARHDLEDECFLKCDSEGGSKVMKSEVVTYKSPESVPYNWLMR